jgi:hypothetical protein
MFHREENLFEIFCGLSFWSVQVFNYPPPGLTLLACSIEREGGAFRPAED